MFCEKYFFTKKSRGEVEVEVGPVRRGIGSENHQSIPSILCLKIVLDEHYRNKFTHTDKMFAPFMIFLLWLVWNLGPVFLLLCIFKISTVSCVRTPVRRGLITIVVHPRVEVFVLQTDWRDMRKWMGVIRWLQIISLRIGWWEEQDKGTRESFERCQYFKSRTACTNT